MINRNHRAARGCGGCAGNAARSERNVPCRAENNRCECSYEDAQNGMNGKCRELLRKLQKVDFCLVETVLYLDAYPHCRKALDHYHKLLEEQRCLKEALQAEGCAPICATDNRSASEWRWTMGPWPWEPEANG